jgi:16S rRNA G966 N2-methylase RsmD
VRVEARPVEEFVADPTRGRFDVIFLGPPYPLFRDRDATLHERVLPRLAGLLEPSGTVVVESPAAVSPSPEGLSPTRFREYGETWLHFLGAC